MNLARGILVLLLLWSYRLARAALALFGLAQLFGTAGALALVVLAAALRLSWLLRLAAFGTMLWIWRWPWWAAAVIAAPRLLLVLPGSITALLARWRHPRPLWPAPLGAAAPAALAAAGRPAAAAPTTTDPGSGRDGPCRRRADSGL